jgi:fumarate hydratase class II
MAGTRVETDSLGPIEVAADRYWGAQTERARRNFRIGCEPMPLAIIEALALIKRVAAEVNLQLGLIDLERAQAIMRAAQEVADGRFATHFPLLVWQAGSGTQSNMNVNEVIANRANEILGQPLGTKDPVHPNDHVNLGQSSNDCFPTAMHIACVQQTVQHLLPALDRLAYALELKAQHFANVVKIGRTHLQDATPITFGQELSGYASQLRHGMRRITHALQDVMMLAQGGTAVGTGLNTHRDFALGFAHRMAQVTGHPFTSAPNKFEALASHDALVFFHGALNACAAALFKIASDIRLLASGPRAGLNELRLPENEPGSSIMPGKVNPTQAEALTMVCARIFGNDATVSFAAAQGHLELNVFKPVIACTILQSIRLMADATASFHTNCIEGLEVNEEAMQAGLERSLMLVTSLVPVIGYDRAARLAHAAHLNGTSLREEALRDSISAQDYDRLVDPLTMTRPGRQG